MAGREILSIFAKIINFFDIVQPSMQSLGKINHQILNLALPAIFSNITVPLLGLCDTFITGHLGSERYIAAVAVGTMLVNSLYWLFGFLRMGTTGLTAEAFGWNDEEMQRRIFTSSLILALLLGMALILLNRPLAQLMLFIMDPPEATARLGADYFRLSILSAPAMLASMAVTGWMIGRQNTLYPMILALSVNIINITLSFWFVFGLESGFIGVAAGTCAANWCGLFLALFLARGLQSEDRLLAPLRGLWKAMDMRRFFRVNSDLMLRSGCIMAVLFAMTSFAGRMGDNTLAVNAILMQFFMFFSYFMDGFAFSGEAMCGKFAGAAERGMITLTVKGLGLWSALMVVLFTLIYLFFITPVTSLLTDEGSVISGVTAMRTVAALIPVISASAFIFDGIYIGITATRQLFFTTVAATAAFFAIAFTSADPVISGMTPNETLWTAFLAFLMLRGILLAGMLRFSVEKSISRSMTVASDMTI